MPEATQSIAGHLGEQEAATRLIREAIVSRNATDVPTSIEEVNRRLAELRQLLLAQYNVETGRTDPLWKAVLYGEVLAHRVVDLASDAIALQERGSYVAAMTLVRATVETAAMLYCLIRKLRQYADDLDARSLEESVLNFLFGSKLDEAEYNMPNVLTGLKHLEREFSGAKRMHAILSEFVHPNGGGVLMSYSEPNSEGTAFSLGPRQDPSSKPIALESLAIALSVSVYLLGQLRGSVEHAA